MPRRPSVAQSCTLKRRWAIVVAWPLQTRAQVLAVGGKRGEGAYT